MTRAANEAGGAAAVVGVLGGGQLGRMLAMAAAKLGLRARIYAPPGDAPATQVVESATRGSDDFHVGLANFAKSCDVLTFETENVPLSALDVAGRFTPLRPSRRAIAVAQDRLEEKRFMRELGVGTTEFHPIDGLHDLRARVLAIGGSGILKTRRMGYDGKGQARIDARDADEALEQARRAFLAIDRAPSILESFAHFERELSIIAARDMRGEIACYDPAENRHVDGILAESVVPGAISDATRARAEEIARKILTGLDYVGVLAVEFFEMADGRLLVNEIAPRVHNSGHWTIEACAVSQFEQHVRAICGWPLGDPRRHADAVMTNLIGDAVEGWATRAPEPGASLHIYGKSDSRPGRKMGHVTALAPLGSKS